MKEELLKWIVCPICKNKLSLRINQKENNEIKKGSLMCKCGQDYPIINYIPRFVKTDKYVKNFSFEWNIHKKTQLDCFNKIKESEKTFKEKTNFDLSKIKNKLILDVGCGSGRFADITQKYGSNIIGVDLSFAVDAAFQNLGLRKNIHLIQADVFNLPFKQDTFDYIYSIGVLHHTPNCKKAFKQLPRLLKNNGKISIWVYGFYNTKYIVMSQLWRKITTRLPKKLLYSLSYIAIPSYYLKKIPFFGKLLDLLIPTSQHKNWRWQLLDTFDWYSPTYQSKHTYPEVFKWFEEENLKEIKPLDYSVSMTGIKK